MGDTLVALLSFLRIHIDCIIVIYLKKKHVHA